MNDPDIRSILMRYIDSALKPNSIRHEMPVGSTRLDVTAFTSNEIHGYEIKGDNDTLSRLKRQVSEYDSVCDFSYVVIGEKYKNKAILYVPEHWGILLCKCGVLMTIRYADKNTRQNPRHLLDLCWKTEIAGAIGCKKYLPKYEVIDKAIEKLSIEQIKLLAIKYANAKRT